MTLPQVRGINIRTQPGLFRYRSGSVDRAAGLPPVAVELVALLGPFWPRERRTLRGRMPIGLVPAEPRRTIGMVSSPRPASALEGARWQRALR